MSHLPTIAIDFDGVIHNYKTWKGASVIDQPPVDGALDFIRSMIDNNYKVVVYTARMNPKDKDYSKVVPSIENWLSNHGLEEHYLARIEFSITKPPAILYIDDRGFFFQGIFPSLDYIKNFTPWNK
jgi:hypothetical protein